MGNIIKKKDDNLLRKYFDKWKEIAKLPSDRFKCNLISDENNLLFLFGLIIKFFGKEEEIIVKSAQ